MPTGDIPRAWLAWSSGKDSLWALHLARESGEVAIVGLLATITDPYGRVSMHGVRESLVEAQAAALGLPLHLVRIPSPCSNEEYEERMARAMEEARRLGVTHVVFGDVRLADVRAYREERLGSVGMEAAFPLWGRDSRALAEEIIAGGVRAVVTCLDPRTTPRELAGREFDGELLRQLPDEVDPCGENGEFHTFAWDGPGFAVPIAVEVGETVERDGFVFTDVVRADEGAGE